MHVCIGYSFPRGCDRTKAAHVQTLDGPLSVWSVCDCFVSGREEETSGPKLSLRGRSRVRIVRTRTDGHWPLSTS